MTDHGEARIPKGALNPGGVGLREEGAGSFKTLDRRRMRGLCARCAADLTDKERALEGVGGSYVRCDRCVRELIGGSSGV